MEKDKMNILDEKKETSFYIVIPATVLNDNFIQDKAKILYGHISGLIRYSEKIGYGYCYALNSYFAKRLNTSKSNISRLISQLREAKHIDVHVIYRPNSREVYQRYITLGQIEKPSKEDVDAFLKKDMESKIEHESPYR